MKKKLICDWEDLTSTQIRIGLNTSLSPVTLAYHLNKTFNWDLKRGRIECVEEKVKEEDHSVVFKGEEHLFSLYKGTHKEPLMPVFLLQNLSYKSKKKEGLFEADLFGTDSPQTQIRLSKHPRKPDYFILFQPEDETINNLSVWISHLGQIKGVISAFEFIPAKAKEEENFILD
jgi:hypothetical protein